MPATAAARSVSNSIQAATSMTAPPLKCSSITPTIASPLPVGLSCLRAHHPAACINYDPSHFLLQQPDYCISGFHVKDAEFRPSGRVGVYGGYQPWNKRAGRFRSVGDGQVDFKRIFTLLTEARFDGWVVLEWECCVKSPEQGVREGAPFIRQLLIESTTVAFDDFAKSGGGPKRNRAMLGLA
jgi:Xylose isomerase-like TIM barrel